MAELKKGISKFNLIGKVNINDKTFIINKKGNGNKNYTYNRLALGVDCSNVEGESFYNYCELMGGYEPNKTKIYAHGFKDDDKNIADYENKIEIPFEKRNTSLIEDVAEDCFIKIAIVKDINGNLVIKKFISEYDAIQYLNENLKDGTVVTIRGNLKFESYAGKTNIKKYITSIWASNAKVEDYKATFDQQVLFTQESFGEKDEEGFLPIYSYVVDYSRDDECNVCYPFTLNIDTKKIKKYDLLVSNYLRPKTADGVNKIGICGSWSKSDNTQEVKYEDLSDDLKALIDMGMLTEDQALGRAIGTSKGVYRAVLNSLATRKNDAGVDIFVIDNDGYKKEELIIYSTPEENKEDEVPFDTKDTKTSKPKEQKSELNEEELASQQLMEDLFGD